MPGWYHRCVFRFVVCWVAAALTAQRCTRLDGLLSAAALLCGCGCAAVPVLHAVTFELYVAMAAMALLEVCCGLQWECHVAACCCAVV